MVHAMAEMSFIMCRKLSIGHFNCFAIKCHFSLVTTMQLNKLMHYHYYTCNSLQITTSNITNGNLFVTLEKVASLIQIFSSIVPWLFRVLIKCWWQSGGRSGQDTGNIGQDQSSSISTSIIHWSSLMNIFKLSPP